MATISFKVEHALGKVEAMRRIRAAAEEHKDKVGSFVKDVQWSADGAHVEGKGFSGDLKVDERVVTIDAELGFPASLMPLKIQREAEGWLGKYLGG